MELELAAVRRAQLAANAARHACEPARLLALEARNREFDAEIKGLYQYVAAAEAEWERIYRPLRNSLKPEEWDRLYAGEYDAKLGI